MLVINSQAPVPTKMVVIVYNTLGQNVYSFTMDNTTNVSKSVVLPATGTYLVSVIANNQIINKKVIYQSR